MTSENIIGNFIQTNNGEININNNTKEDTKMFGDYRDSIRVLASMNDYTLLEYEKGGRTEWNVVHNYISADRTWDSGNYAYTIENAFFLYMYKLNDSRIKSDNQRSVEDEYSITYDRMSELATKFKDGLIEDDEDEAMKFFDEECEMTDSEKKYFGVFKQKYKVVEIKVVREQTANIKVVMPEDEPTYNAMCYVENPSYIEPDDEGEWEDDYTYEYGGGTREELLNEYSQDEVWNYDDLEDDRIN